MVERSVKIEPLCADNYDTWKLHMRAILIKADLWSYADGTKPCPHGDAATKWRLNDQKACADIILSTSPSELGLISDCETSHEMWMKLQSTFQSKGPARKATLLKRIALARLKEGDNVREHLNEFFHAVSKLKEINVTVGDDLLAILLIYSLPESFETFRCALETRDELPSPEVLRVKILEENQSRKAKEAAAEQNGLLANSKVKHFKKFVSNPSGNVKRKAKGESRTCYNCGGNGHIARNCRAKQNTKSSYPNARRIANAETENSFLFESACLSANSCSYWCLDSGCSSHMSSYKNSFDNFKEMSRTLSLANNDTAEIKGVGNIKADVDKKGVTERINLEQVMYVPDLRTNLLSVSKIADKGYEVCFRRDEAEVIKSGKTILLAKRIGDLYYVNTTQTVAAVAANKHTKLYKWHISMGHLNERDLKRLPSMVHGIEVNAKEQMPPCEICLSEKQTQKSFAKHKQGERRTTDLIEIVHTDVCGPMRTGSHSGAKYFVTFTDDYSKYSEVYFIKHKSEVFEMFKKFKNSAETLTGRRVRALQSDNGREYINHDFQKYLDDCGIKRRLTAPHTPQQNGVSERKNRTLLEMARCMLRQANLPLTFWAEAVNTANYIRNRCPTKSLSDEVPLKVWTGKTPTVAHMKPFGVKAFVLIKGKTTGKFDSRSEACIFVGYSNEAKAYRLWLPENRKIVISRDIKFCTEMFYNNKNDVDEPLKQQIIEIIVEPNDDLNMPEEDTSKTENVNVKNEQRSRGRPRLDRKGLPGRPKKIYKNIIEETADTNDSDNSTDLEDCEFANLAISNDPTTIKEAISGDEAATWLRAIEDEYFAQLSNNTWDIVESPLDRKIIGSRFVFRTKEGNTKKARLVAKGCSQRPGEDFTITYSPVTRLASVRLMAALSAEMGLVIHQMDVITAYLNGDLDEDVYMEVPEYLDVMLKKVILRESESTLGPKAKHIQSTAQTWQKLLKSCNKPVCRLRKSLYGLRQSGYQWYQKLTTKLLKIGLMPSKRDPCLFFMRKNEKRMLITIYVDDLLMASNDEQLLKQVKRSLAENFEMKDIGPIKTFLGIEFHQDLKTNSVFLGQRKYAEEILIRFGMEQCKPIQTPMELNCRLEKPASANESEMKIYPYQNLLGALMYLSVTTRPDIAFAVSFLSQFNSNYSLQHWKAAKRVLRYVKGTINYGLLYKKSDFELYGVADADWGANLADRRSYSGFAFILAGAPISWEARKQRIVSLSTTESEYMALCETTKEALYLREILNEIGWQQNCITIYNDSQSAQNLVKSSAYHSRTKHIDVRHHFIREKYQNGDIDLQYMQTEEMPADVLTKGLSSQKHYRCILDLGMKEADGKKI